MAETQKSCVICGGEEKDGELLVDAPCGRHSVCPDDISSFFERATQNESLFPPKCCGQMFMLQEYEDYVPFDIAWAFQIKEQGEYAVLAKFRVYCGNPFCGQFLHPSAHVTDSEANITYAICEGDACGKLTCTGCKTLLDQGTQNHACKKDENEEKFKQTATEKGYQQCNLCGATVELTEACNHITCECGHDFCYICGKDWPGLHGCPHYGPTTFDEEDYNQEGYHRDTGLNREGLTRRQENIRRRGENPDDDDDEGEDDDGEGEEDDIDWEVLRHLEPDQRVIINGLHGHHREDALDQLRITLFETQGIMFGQDPLPQPPVDQEQNDGEQDGDEDEDEANALEAGLPPLHGPRADALLDFIGDNDEVLSEASSEGDPNDDGDVFIDEEALQANRFADDQSEDNIDIKDTFPAHPPAADPNTTFPVLYDENGIDNPPDQDPAPRRNIFAEMTYRDRQALAAENRTRVAEIRDNQNRFPATSTLFPGINAALDAARIRSAPPSPPPVHPLRLATRGDGDNENAFETERIERPSEALPWPALDAFRRSVERPRPAADAGGAMDGANVSDFRAPPGGWPVYDDGDL